VGIGGVVERAWQGLESAGVEGEVIVVDNGSTDASTQIAEQLGATIVTESRRGYGSAYLAGLAAARGTYVVLADADGTYDLGKLRPFIDELEAGADLVMGSRLRGRIHPGAMPWSHRWIGNPAITRLINLFFRVGISDAYCGMRAIRRDAIPRLGLQALGLEFALEMELKAAKRNLRIVEVPIEYYPRQGASKLNTIRDGWRSLRFMLVHASTFLFLIPGSILLASGLIVTAALSTGPVTVFGREWQIHALIFGSTATLVGAQIVQLGIFARSYAVLYLDEREPLLEQLWLRIRLEHGLLLGALLTLAGGGLLLAIFVEWARGGFGALSREHSSLVGLTLVGLGVQTIFGSFFLSIIGLQKHLVFGRRDAFAEDAIAREPSGIES
jgi:hypothetical protein